MLSRGPQLACADAGTSWQIADARRCHRPRSAKAVEDGCPWHFRRRFASSLRRRALASYSWSLNRAVFEDGRQHGEQDQGARPRPALGACATRPGLWPRRQYMLAEERLCKRHPGAQHPCSSTAVPESQSSQILLNSACRLRPASRTVAG